MVMKKLKGFLKWVKEVVFVFNRHAGLLKSIKIEFPFCTTFVLYCAFEG